MTVFARRRARGSDDRGSVLPLTIGYALLAMIAVLVCVDATSLYLAQQRLDALADAAALAAADGFTLTVVDGRPVARLDAAEVREQADALLTAAGGPATLVDARTPDGLSDRVTIETTWRPPAFVLFVPDGVDLTATATSRTSLG